MREQNLLQRIYSANADLGGLVSIPPGDDMGAMTIGGSQVLVTVDQVADGVHVRVADTPIEKVGRKAIARSLSDVAAMAALPLGAVAAVALPKDLGEARAERLFEVMRRTAASYDCPLIGGDITLWNDPLLVTVTVFADPAGIEPVLRSGARIDDELYVTGRLGGSLETVNGTAHHQDFEPRVRLARALALQASTRPHCMIDLSDGLAKDLRHLCEASGVAARIEAESLPISAAARQAASRGGRPEWQHAVGDGEDYELLFTAAPDQRVSIPDVLGGVPITRIGTIERPEGPPRVEMRFADDQVINLLDFGWEHRS